jgi:hypothetical protein
MESWTNSGPMRGIGGAFSSGERSASVRHISSHLSTLYGSDGIHTFTVVLAGLKIS